MKIIIILSIPTEVILLSQGHRGSIDTELPVLTSSTWPSPQHFRDSHPEMQNHPPPGTLGCDQAFRTTARPHTAWPRAPRMLQLLHGDAGVSYSRQGFPKAQSAFILFNSYILFQPPPKCICLQKEPQGEVQPTNKNIIITQFSCAWASPGYSPVLYNSIVSPSRLYLIG